MSCCSTPPPTSPPPPPPPTINTDFACVEVALNIKEEKKKMQNFLLAYKLPLCQLVAIRWADGVERVCTCVHLVMGCWRETSAWLNNCCSCSGVATGVAASLAATPVATPLQLQQHKHLFAQVPLSQLLWQCYTTCSLYQTSVYTPHNPSSHTHPLSAKISLPDWYGAL